jgi:cytochrome c oxidase cbb3-type subunit III
MVPNSKSRSVLAVFLAASSLVVWSQGAQQSLPQKGIKSVSSGGKQAFASTCAECHGLDGKGSERAPNIADRQTVQRLSDAQIFQIIENGIPGTGMPAFHSLSNSQIKTLVSYLRTLQGREKTTSLPGDPTRGKTIFFGKAGCSGCHMVAGEGGFIASDLSAYAGVHSVKQIRDDITKPADSQNGRVRLVTTTLHGGEKYVGRVRDEDNFSLQLETLDGAFHFMSKSDIEKLEYDSKPLMPSDYSSRLEPGELDDIVSYLMSLAGASESGPHTKAEEWEQ